jgi:saccharopine dehydrogenase-like NADP-dependent oxidoreductase
VKITLIGGAGLMARATARDLVESRPELELVLADLNLAGAQEVARGLRDARPESADRVSELSVDASDVTSVREAIRGSDAVINSALYYFNLTVMEAALAEEVPYVDLGGLFHVTREQLPRSADFERAGVTAIIGIGSTPGITNVQAAHAATLLDRIDRIAVYCGNTPNADSPAAWGYSINTIIDEATKPSVVFRDGELRELEPLAEPEMWSFLDPIGEKEVHHSLHSEIATLPFTFADRGVQESFFKINYFGYTPSALRELKALAESGRPREEVLAELTWEGERRAAEARARGEDPDAFVVDHEEVAVDVFGTSPEGRPRRVRVDTMGVGRSDWQIAGGTLLTATPPGIVATWLAEGSLRVPGVHPPESVIPPERLFQELEHRGMKTTVDVRDG